MYLSLYVQIRGDLYALECVGDYRRHPGHHDVQDIYKHCQ
jgi:hypothetical protein